MSQIGWIAVLILGLCVVLLNLLPRKTVRSRISLQVGDREPREWQRERHGYFLGLWGWAGLITTLIATWHLLV